MRKKFSVLTAVQNLIREKFALSSLIRAPLFCHRANLEVSGVLPDYNSIIFVSLATSFAFQQRV